MRVLHFLISSTDKQVNFLEKWLRYAIYTSKQFLTKLFTQAFLIRRAPTTLRIYANVSKLAYGNFKHCVATVVLHYSAVRRKHWVASSACPTNFAHNYRDSTEVKPWIPYWLQHYCWESIQVTKILEKGDCIRNWNSVWNKIK